MVYYCRRYLATLLRRRKMHARKSFIVGASALPLVGSESSSSSSSPLLLMARAVTEAVKVGCTRCTLTQRSIHAPCNQDAEIRMEEVTGLVASPSLAPGLSFMPAHQVATFLGLMPSASSQSQGLHAKDRPIHVTSVDTGGASPISGERVTSRQTLCPQETCSCCPSPQAWPGRVR